ncbi:MAG: hypothetical protein JW840_07800 [Candidatus Thermoplasmatota archaeon]|nr:hypothetical protein [Candidatus Thermoplasmatota archaeon]
MKTKNFLIKKTRAVPRKTRGIAILLTLTILIAPTLSFHGMAKIGDISSTASWKNYPYHPPGTDIVFPTDEGAHDTAQFPIEWWYVNFHLTGQSSGQEYGSFVAFYKIQTNHLENKEMRIFSISDIANKETYTNVQIGTLTASADHLDLGFQYFTTACETHEQTLLTADDKNIISEKQDITMTTEETQATVDPTNYNSLPCLMPTETTQSTNTLEQNYTGYGMNTEEPIQLRSDYWYTKANDPGLLPFQYRLEVTGNSQQDHQPMSLAVDMDCQKRPLIVGGDGIVELGKDNRISYYYSLCKLEVTGTITAHGITENVIGFSWIDHQWGDFLNQNPPPYGLVVSYEWFSIKLNDNREILAGDTWDQETGEKIDVSFSSGLNLLDNDGTLYLLEDYTIEPISYWHDLKTRNVYAAKWRITESSQSIKINITPSYEDQMMRIGDDNPLIRQIVELIIPGSCFWEGTCIVSGTINGVTVQGKAYVELTHHYNNEYTLN